MYIQSKTSKGMRIKSAFHSTRRTHNQLSTAKNFFYRSGFLIVTIGMFIPHVSDARSPTFAEFAGHVVGTIWHSQQSQHPNRPNDISQDGIANIECSGVVNSGALNIGALDLCSTIRTLSTSEMDSMDRVLEYLPEPIACKNIANESMFYWKPIPTGTLVVITDFDRTDPNPSLNPKYKDCIDARAQSWSEAERLLKDTDNDGLIGIADVST